MIISDVKKGKGKATGKHDVGLSKSNEEYVFLPWLSLILLSLNADVPLTGVIVKLDMLHQLQIIIQTGIYTCIDFIAVTDNGSI